MININLFEQIIPVIYTRTISPNMTGMPTQPTLSRCRSPLYHLLVHFSPYAGTIGVTFL